MTPRHQPLYHVLAIRTARAGRQRHLFRATGLGYPRSLCGDAQGTPTAAPDPLAPRCPECHLVGVTELALALDLLGLHGLAVQVGAAVRDLSFEVPKTQTA